MNMRRAAAVPIVVVSLSFAACSSSVPEDFLEPTVAPSSTPSNDLARIGTTSSPTLADRSCTDFASTADAQAFYLEAGGPDQDLHGLDPDRNGTACDDQSPAPVVSAPAGGGGTQAAEQPPATGQQPVTAPATPGPPQEVHSSSGAAAGESGGSSEQSSCTSSDNTACD